jgi:hypothetical protein
LVIDPSILGTGKTLADINLGCPTGVDLSDFISKMPTDPSTGASYGYVKSGSPPSDYVLYTTFETTNTVMSQSAPNPSWWQYPSTANYNCLNAATTPNSSNDYDYCVRPN